MNEDISSTWQIADRRDLSHELADDSRQDSTQLVPLPSGVGSVAGTAAIVVHTPAKSEEQPIGSPRFTAGDYAKATLVGVEVLPPTSGFLRYGALALALTQTRDPGVGAAVLGGSTFALEYASYRAALGWLENDSFRVAYDALSAKWSDIRQRVAGFRQKKKDEGWLGWGRAIPSVPDIPKLPEEAKLNLPGQALLTLEAGTVALLATKQLIEKNRDERHIRRDGRASIAFVSGVLALQGAAISEGTNLFFEYTKIASAALGAAAVTYGLFRYFRAKRTANKEGA